jgi:hypothetical protein
MKCGSCSALVLATVLAVGQPPAFARAQAADTTTKIDPDAIQALTRMGAYLRTLKAMEVRAAMTTEDVLLDGQKVQSMKTATLVAETPIRMRLDVADDRQPRLFLYDGKTFTLYAPRSSYYASIPAPPTINELANLLDDKYDIDLPFVDLFRWGTPESNIADITAATDIGPDQVDGTTCEHYAFRQAGLDWEVWMQNGDFPLPRRLVLTTMTDDARPQYTATYTWNLAPSVSADAYTFTPPKDAKKITFAEAKAARDAATVSKKQENKK